MPRSARSERAGSEPGSKAPPPDPWQEYVDRIGEAPETGTVRGLFFVEILRLVPNVQFTQSRVRYLPFSNYPQREYMQLLVEAGRVANPLLGPQATLRMLGRTVYTTFASSMAGATLFSGLHDDVERLLDLVPRAYELCVAPGRVSFASRGQGEAVAELREHWVFPEVYHVGIWLGALDALGMEGSVDVFRHSRSAVDFHVRWRPK